MSILQKRRWQREARGYWTSGCWSSSGLRNVDRSCYSLLLCLAPIPGLCCSSAGSIHLRRCCGGCGSDGGSDAFRDLPSGSLSCHAGSLWRPCPPADQHDASDVNGRIWMWTRSLFPVGSGKRNVESLSHLHSALLSPSPDPCVLFLYLGLYLCQRAVAAQTEALEVAWVDAAACACLNLQHWDRDREAH